MSKRKLILVAVALCMVAILATGGTMAYFFDTDAAKNVFTVGNVDITLNENFGDNDPATPENLVPTTGKDEDGNVKNAVTKEVDVTNSGSEPAYVRVHIAFPQILDSGSEDDPALAAYNNLLHWNFAMASVADGQWNWNTSVDGPNYPGNGGNWNVYVENIDDVAYNVYVATYMTVLEANETTDTKAMTQVYLEQTATNEAVAAVKAVLGANWQVLVVAEGTQAEGFADAYEALNTTFGMPGRYAVDWSGCVLQ